MTLTIVTLVLIVVISLSALCVDTDNRRVHNRHGSFRYYQIQTHDEASDEAANQPQLDRKVTDASYESLSDTSSWLKESTTLTRLGAHLNFEPTISCPVGSLMLQGDSTRAHRKPKTSLCPKLFIIGAKKGGTTSLYNYVSQHPDFQGIRLNVSVMIGETAYFASKYKQEPLSTYLNLFPRQLMSGDASVDNFVHCKAPQRIFRTCGSNVKAVVLLRDPIKRYLSNFLMRVSRNEYGAYNNDSSITILTKKELLLLRNAAWEKGVTFPTHHSSWTKLRCIFGCCKSMIYEGMYYVFLMNWLCNFPSKNLLIVNSEELFHKPSLILEQVIRFVGLRDIDKDDLSRITTKVYNKGFKSRLEQHILRASDIQKLVNVYRPFNTELLKLLDWHGKVQWYS